MASALHSQSCGEAIRGPGGQTSPTATCAFHSRKEDGHIGFPTSMGGGEAAGAGRRRWGGSQEDVGEGCGGRWPPGPEPALSVALGPRADNNCPFLHDLQRSLTMYLPCLGSHAELAGTEAHLGRLRGGDAEPGRQAEVWLPWPVQHCSGPHPHVSGGLPLCLHVALAWAWNA